MQLGCPVYQEDVDIYEESVWKVESGFLWNFCASNNERFPFSDKNCVVDDGNAIY